MKNTPVILASLVAAFLAVGANAADQMDKEIKVKQEDIKDKKEEINKKQEEVSKKQEEIKKIEEKK